MEQTPKKWYTRWWAILLAMLLGSVVGWLLKTYCYMAGEAGLNL